MTWSLHEELVDLQLLLPSKIVVGGAKLYYYIIVLVELKQCVFVFDWCK